MKITEYAKKHNLSYQTARNTLRKLGMAYTNYQMIQQVYSKNKTIEQMSQESGASESSVRNYLTKFNLIYRKQYRKTRVASEKTNQILLSYRQGESVQNISSKFNVSKQYIYRVLHQAGVKVKQKKEDKEVFLIMQAERN